MTVAVTGANGLVGANLVRLLLEQGAEVRPIVYGDCTPLDGLGLECVECDVLDPAAIRRALAGAEVVYHLASVITLSARSHPYAETVNVNGARNVAEACLEDGVARLVHCSSIHAFSPEPADQPVDEGRPLCAADHPFPYDRSKAAGQRAILEAVGRGLDAVVVHPTGIIGPFDFMPSRSGKGMLDLHHGRTRALVAGGFNWVDVRDVCHGAMAAAEKGRTGENYILSGHYLSLRALAQAVAAITGCRAPRFVVPMWLAGAAVPLAEVWSWATGREPRFTRFTLQTLVHHREVSHAKAARELGYRPRPIEETLRDTFDWFRDAGMLK